MAVKQEKSDEAHGKPVVTVPAQHVARTYVAGIVTKIVTPSLFPFVLFVPSWFKIPYSEGVWRMAPWEAESTEGSVAGEDATSVARRGRAPCRAAFGQDVF